MQVNFGVLEGDLSALQKELGAVDAEAADTSPEVLACAVVGDEDKQRKAAAMV